MPLLLFGVGESLKPFEVYFFFVPFFQTYQRVTLSFYSNIQRIFFSAFKVEQLFCMMCLRINCFMFVLSCSLRPLLTFIFRSFIPRIFFMIIFSSFIVWFYFFRDSMIDCFSISLSINLLLILFTYFFISFLFSCFNFHDSSQCPLLYFQWSIFSLGYLSFVFISDKLWYFSHFFSEISQALPLIFLFLLLFIFVLSF